MHEAHAKDEVNYQAVKKKGRRWKNEYNVRKWGKGKESDPVLYVFVLLTRFHIYGYMLFRDWKKPCV